MTQLTITSATTLAHYTRRMTHAMSGLLVTNDRDLATEARDTTLLIEEISNGASMAMLRSTLWGRNRTEVLSALSAIDFIHDLFEATEQAKLSRRVISAREEPFEIISELTFSDFPVPAKTDAYTSV